MLEILKAQGRSLTPRDRSPTGSTKGQKKGSTVGDLLGLTTAPVLEDIVTSWASLSEAVFSRA